MSDTILVAGAENISLQLRQLPKQCEGVCASTVFICICMYKCLSVDADKLNTRTV